MKKVNQIFVIIFIALIFVLFLAILSGKIFSRQIAELNKKSSTSNSDTVNIDWEKQYPYDISVKTDGVPKYNTGKEVSTITKLADKISQFGNLGNTLATSMFKYKEISQSANIINSKLTDISIAGNYTRLKNGYWVSTENTKKELESAENILSNYYYLQEYLKSEGIDFMYCYAPVKECKADDQLPDGVTSYTNTNIDTYIEGLKSLNINYIDLREKLHEDGLEHYSLFYKTDPHWNIDGGFWAASVIERELNENFNLDMENVSQVGAFYRKTYENAVFGSAGQAVTHFNVQSENFDILFPNFETNFSLEIPDKNIYATGSFEDVFINYDGLNAVIEEGGGYAYEQILYGNRPYEKIINLNNPNGLKILMIRDSFSIAVAPYLACSCSELVLLDTRSENGNFTGSVVSCINQFKPDIVLALQSKPQTLTLNKE